MAVTAPVPNLDVRAQILANAMILFPQIVQAHIDASRKTLLEPNKIFDVVYFTDDPAPRDKPGTLVQLDDDGDDRQQEVIRACLIARNAQNPALCQILVQTARGSAFEVLATELLQAVVASLRNGTQRLEMPAWRAEDNGSFVGGGRYFFKSRLLNEAEAFARECRRARSGAGMVSWLWASAAMWLIVGRLIPRWIRQ